MTNSIYLVLGFSFFVNLSCGKPSEPDQTSSETPDSIANPACAAATTGEAPALALLCAKSTEGAPVATKDTASSTTPKAPVAPSDEVIEAQVVVPRVAKFQPSDIYFNLQDNCGRCHDWVEIEASVKLKAPAAISRITGGNMPRGVSGWDKSPQGKALLDYLGTLVK